MIKCEGEAFLKQGETCSVTVTEVGFNDDCELIIWVQAGLGVDETLDQITKVLHSAVPTREPLSTLQTGKLCMCQYTEDLEWYRARVETQISPGKWKARFIDYGNCQVFNDDSLFNPPPTLQQYPDLAIKLALDKTIQPIGCASLWTPAIVNAISSAFMYQKVEVDVTKVYGDNLFEVHCEEINALLEEKKLVRLGLAYPKCSFPKGGKFQAYVSSVTENGTLYLQELNSSKELDILMDALTDYYRQPENLVSITKQDLKVGSLVASVYKRDGACYRAQVVNLNKESCVVHYIDYGNSEEQDIDSIFVLANQFCGFNYQAIPCGLHGLHIPEESCSKKLQAFLFDQLSEQLIDIEIEEHLLSKLSISGRYQGEELGSSLLLNGFAELKQFPQKITSNYPELESVKSATVLQNVNIEKNGLQFSAEEELSRMEAKSYSQVAVCFVEDPDRMWIQRLSSDRELFKLITEMKLFYSSLPPPTLCFQQPQFHDLCAVAVQQSRKETWYRGQVLCMCGDLVDVKLIDFGNEVKVPLNNVKKLSPEFELLKPQALKCKLSNVIPVAEQWSVAANRELYRLTQVAKKIYGKFIETQEQSCLVELIVNIDGREINVSEKLVQEGFARWLNEPSSNVKMHHTNANSHSILQSLNSYDKEISPHGLFYHSPGVALVGAELKVTACDVQSPDDFFLKIDSPNHNSQYAQLAKDVNEICSSPSPGIHADQLYVGMPCSVLCDRTRLWCRGAVLCFEDLEILKVCLVDFGRIVQCRLSDLRQIPAPLVAEAPPAAMRCTLQGLVASKTSVWTVSAMVLAQDFLQTNKRNLLCTIHGCASDNLSTYFICGIRTPFSSLADELVKHEFAVKPDRIGRLLPPLKLKSFVYSNLNVVKGKEATFRISHLQDSNMFHCQLSTYIPILNTMLHELQLHCIQGNRGVVTPEILMQECVCFAKNDGKQWNRAHFLSCEPHGCVKVLFVDFGNTAVVSLSEVQRFSNEKFFDLPIQALPCCMEDIDMSHCSAEQKQNAFCLMENLCSYKDLKGVVAGSTNGKLCLDLFSEGKRISDFIKTKVILKNLSQRQFTTEEPVCTVEEEVAVQVEIMEPCFLRTGAQEPVVVSETTNPSNFYLQFERLNEERKLCEDAVDRFYTAKRNSDYSVDELLPGHTICVQRQKDMKWCRAIVLSVTQNVKVQFVDSGETETVRQSYNIKKLVACMDKWPKMSVACSLAGVKPLSQNYWSQEVAKEFCSVVKSMTCLNASFLCKDEGSDTWLVTLCDGKVDVAHTLVGLGLAVYDTTECKRLQIDCTIPKIAIDAALKWKGEKLVYISHAESTSRIFIQEALNLTKLDALMFEVNDDLKLPEFTLPPKEDMFCLARYDVDKQLYRARIVEVISTDSSKSQVLVSFIDYGNTAVVDVSEIRQINAKYADIPQVAICCQLNVLPDTLTEEEIITGLKELSVAENLTILSTLSVSEFDGSCVADIFVKPSEKERISLHTYLLKSRVNTTRSSVNEHSTGKRSISDTIPKYTTMKNIMDERNREIYVSHVINPGEIYCQFSDCCDDLDTLMHNVDVYYNVDRAEDKVKSINSLSINSQCIAKYTQDGNWYRAQIEIIKSDDEVIVKFVDFGNSELLHVKNIRKTKVGFSVLPALAVHCYVAHVSHDSSAWTTNEVDAFDERVAALKLRATFSRVVDEDNQIFEVMLRLPDDTLLNNEYLNKASGDSTHTGEEPLSTSKHTEQKSQVNVLPNSQSPVPPESCITPMDTVLTELPIASGMVKTCCVSFAKSPANFYVQLADAEENIDSLCILAAEDAQADEKVLKSSDACIGKYCVAQSSEDGEWYRGKITEIGNNATVCFVDYGDSDTVEWSKIKTITKQTTNLPVQSVFCYLTNLPVFPENSKQVVLNAFFETIKDNVFSVKFLKRRPSTKWEVELSLDGVDVSEKLRSCAGASFSQGNVVTIQSPTDQNHFTVDPVVSMLQEYVGDSKVDDVEAGGIRTGQVIYAVSLNSFYVKLDPFVKSIENQSSGSVDHKPIGLKLFFAKRFEQEDWQKAVVVKNKNGENSALFIDDSIAVEIDKIFKTKQLSTSTNNDSEIIHCTFSSVKGSDNQAKITYFNDHVLRKKVFITFQQFDQTSSSWVVDLAFVNNEISNVLQGRSDDVGKPQECNFADGLAHSMATSTPLPPAIIVTSINEQKRKASESLPVSKSAPEINERSQGNEQSDWFSFCVSTFAEVKDMLSQFSSSNDIKKVVEKALEMLEVHNKSKFLHSREDELTADDHKRPSFTSSFVTSPCKKRRLEKFPRASTGTPVIFSTIPENEDENNFTPDLLPCHDLNSDNYYSSVVLSVENPNSFHVKPSFVTGDLPQLNDAGSTANTDTLQSNTLVAFKIVDAEKESCMKRGVVLSLDEGVFHVVDVDSGLKYTVQSDKIFELPEDLKQVPPLAVNCALFDIFPLGKKWTTEACTFFREHLEECDSSITLKFVEQCEQEHGLPKWSVIMKAKETSISDMLVENKHAIFKSESLEEKVATLSEDVEQLKILSNRAPSDDVPVEETHHLAVSKSNVYASEAASSISCLSDSVFATDGESNVTAVSPDTAYIKPQDFEIYDSANRTPSSQDIKLPEILNLLENVSLSNGKDLKPTQVTKGKENITPKELGTSGTEESDNEYYDVNEGNDEGKPNDCLPLITDQICSVEKKEKLEHDVDDVSKDTGNGNIGEQRFACDDVSDKEKPVSAETEQFADGVPTNSVEVLISDGPAASAVEEPSQGIEVEVSSDTEIQLHGNEKNPELEIGAKPNEEQRPSSKTELSVVETKDVVDQIESDQVDICKSEDHSFVDDGVSTKLE